jgi:serine protease Do
VIVAIDETPIGYVGQLQSKVAMHRPGERIALTVYRERQPRDFTIRLGEAPIGDVAPRVAETSAAAEQRLGILVRDMTPELAQQFEYDEAGGAVITQVQVGSPAQRRGLGRGLRIVEINDRPVADAEDVREALAAVDPGSVVQFIVETPDGTSRIINVRMPGT